MEKHNELTFIEELVLCCTSNGVSSEEAQKAARALCRYYGGQMIYVPSRDGAGNGIERVIADAVGDRTASKIFERVRETYGGMQVYIPMERSGFRKIIALEIYKRHGDNGIKINDLAREYGISFTQAYRLWKEGQRNRAGKDIPYLPFLEFAQKPDI